jgi:hypothetical protein
MPKAAQAGAEFYKSYDILQAAQAPFFRFLELIEDQQSISRSPELCCKMAD